MEDGGSENRFEGEMTCMSYKDTVCARKEHSNMSEGESGRKKDQLESWDSKSRQYDL